jgi:two-component system response regulator WspF
MLKIAIVNDTIIAIEALRRVIATVADYQIIWIARNGAEAVANCATMPPDLILMDLHMPNMDGVEATRQIMQQSPCSILIVTATVHANTAKVFESMGYGALDVVRTPILGIQGNPAAAQEFCIKSLRSPNCWVNRAVPSQTQDNLPRSPLSVPRIPAPTRFNCDWCFYGWTQCPGKLLAKLPANFEAAIVVVQHIDEQFTPGLVNG